MSSTGKTVLSIDYSGSVARNELYWKRVHAEYDKVKDVPNLQILAWDDKCRTITQPELLGLIKTQNGNGGTNPRSTIPYLANMDKIDSLIFITDGEISSANVSACDLAICNIRKNIASVSCHIINRCPNISVTTPFTRGVDAVVYTYDMAAYHPITNPNPSSLVFNVTAADYNLLEQIDQISLFTFETKYKTITDAMLALAIGTSGIPRLVDKVISLKRRITAELAASQPSDDALTHALANVNEQVVNGVCQYETNVLGLAQNIVDNYYGGGIAKDLNTKLDRLINLAQRGSQSFTVSQFNTAAHDRAPVALVVEPETAIDCEISETTITYECPISYDIDQPVIIIVEGEPVLKGLPKDVIKSIIRNPLSIIGNSVVCARLLARVKHSVGFGSFIQLQQTTNKEPFTSETIVGCLPLNTCTAHMKVSDSALYNLFVGGKKLGNVDLYFAVLWRLVTCGGIPWLSDSVDIVNHFNAQMTERMRVRKSSVSLSGLPNMITTRMQLGTALWFVLASGVLKMDNDVIPLRTHIFVADVIEKMVSLMGYRLTSNMLTSIRLTRELMSSLTACKQNGRLFYDSRRALYHTHIIIDGTHVFMDCNVSLECGTNIVSGSDVTVAESAYIASIVHPNLSSSKISTPTSRDVDIWWTTIGCKPVANWAIGLVNVPEHKPVYIHPATCRPIFMVELNGKQSTWFESYSAYYGHNVTDKIMSGSNEVGQWISRYKKWPTSDDLIVYAYEREHHTCTNGLPTLPIDICTSVKSMLSDFDEIFRTLTPTEFIKRFNASVKRVDRVRIETSFV